MNRKNLLKLAVYLEALPDDTNKFNMANFIRRPGHWTIAYPAQVPELYAECGTVACAAGHGPMAGIKPKKGEFWVSYTDRVFAQTSLEFDWCFTGAWEGVDNTPNGAAARIRWLLDKGVPDDFHAQVNGDAPLCYVVN